MKPVHFKVDAVSFAPESRYVVELKGDTPTSAYVYFPRTEELPKLGDRYILLPEMAVENVGTLARCRMSSKRCLPPSRGRFLPLSARHAGVRRKRNAGAELSGIETSIRIQFVMDTSRHFATLMPPGFVQVCAFPAPICGMRRWGGDFTGDEGCYLGYRKAHRERHLRGITKRS